MQWSDVTRAPSPNMLRQFGGLLLVFLVAIAAWRAWRLGIDTWVWAIGGAGVGLGALGAVWPMALRPVFTTWMIVAFPIGWTVSRVILAALFYVLFTPIALFFRVIRRDALRLRPSKASSYWLARAAPDDSRHYFRQF